MSDIVLNLLKNNNIPYKASGKDYLIKCLNPEHEDTNPSCRVDRTTGITHCFSCGWGVNLFKHFGVFTNNNVLKIAALKEKLLAVKAGLVDLDMPEGSTPYTKIFRGISVSTLRKFGAFYTHDVEKLKDRVIFPIKEVTGKTVSFIGRHVHSNANPRYVVYPSGNELPCYPVIMLKGTLSIVLVEGIIDMLNLQDKGLPNAVCVFGTSSLKNSAARKLLAFKVQGITHIYIMFDGDDAGNNAALELKPVLEAENFIVEIITLQEDTDPGEMSQEDVDSIIEYIK
jgi:DNA primase